MMIVSFDVVLFFLQFLTMLGVFEISIEFSWKILKRRLVLLQVEFKERRAHTASSMKTIKV